MIHKIAIDKDVLKYQTVGKLRFPQSIFNGRERRLFRIATTKIVRSRNSPVMAISRNLTNIYVYWFEVVDVKSKGGFVGYESPIW